MDTFRKEYISYGTPFEDVDNRSWITVGSRKIAVFQVLIYNALRQHCQNLIVPYIYQAHFHNTASLVADLPSLDVHCQGSCKTLQGQHG